MIPLEADEADKERAKATQGLGVSDTSDQFQDTQADLASFPKTDVQKARDVSNRRTIDPQRTRSGHTNADTAPSRFIGVNMVPWQATRGTKPMMKLAGEAVPFGSSSHLETSRLM